MEGSWELKQVEPNSDQQDKSLIEREDYPREQMVPGMDLNLYAAKKTIAQGMMEIALLTVNASQLRYLLREGDSDRYYFLNIILVSVSISLQVIIGVLLIMNNRYNINEPTDQSPAELMNHVTIIGIFFVTVVNIFLSAFATTH